MKAKIPSVLISSSKSGGGKSLFTAALSEILKNKGLNVSNFKCGPDYVDPILYEDITGKKGKNLDLFFNDSDKLKERFISGANNADIAVIEGAMGFYDGCGGNTDFNSSCHISNCLSVPVILIIDCEGASFSLCALIKGIVEFKRNNIKAVILNKCSASLHSVLKPQIEKFCNIDVLGFIPKEPSLTIRSQKLGLLLDNREENLKSIDTLSHIIENNISVDKILSIAKSTPEIEYSCQVLDNKINLTAAVAQDEAFCFIYDDNINFLKKIGCTVTYFSPLKDKSIPQNADVCILGGGYIGKYIRELSSNSSMKMSVKEFYNNGGFIIAEGGGFDYINKEYKNSSGTYEMCGILNGSCMETERLTNFGYINICDENGSIALKAHEFHYSCCSDDGSYFTAKRYSGKNERKTIHKTPSLFCGYPQFDYLSNELFMVNLFKSIKDGK